MSRYRFIAAGLGFPLGWAARANDVEWETILLIAHLMIFATALIALGVVFRAELARRESA